MARSFRKPSAKTLALQVCLVLATLQFAGCSSREQRAQNYYDQGMSYLEKKDYVKARIELRNALQIKGDLVPAWRALAQIEEHERNVQGLAASLRRVVELDAKDVDSRIKLARLLLVGGALDDALKITNAASELDPQNPNILALKAAVLFRLKDADGATQTAQKALEIDPGNTDSSVVLAAAKFMQGDNDGALRELEKVTSAHQDDLGVLFLKINVFDRMGNLSQVEALLRKLIELNPKEPSFRTQLIRFYVRHQRQDDAITELRTVVAANPADTNAELELVNLLGALKGPAAAREELVERIKAGDRVFPYQLTLAKLDFAQGNVTDSTKLLEGLIAGASSQEDGIAARTALAEMYLAKNNVAAAEPVIAEVLRLDNRNIAGLRMRAAVHLDRGEIDDAVADLRRALNDQPQSPELLAGLALTYERGGSIELADKAFLDATKASKFAPVYGLNYVAFLRRRGLATQAENVLADLASRNPTNLSVLSQLAQVKLARQDWVGAHAIADAMGRLGGKGGADQINAAAFSGEKKFDDSLALLQSAYEANPGATQPMAALISGYLQAQQTDKAESFLQAALKANPKNSEALVLMGSLQLAKNDPAQAEKSFQTAIEVQPKDISGYRALSDLYIRQKKTDDALKVLREGLQQQPNNFAMRLSLAGLLEAKGEYEPAIAEYDAMLKDQPGSMILANNLASLLSDRRTDKDSLDRAHSLAVLLNKSQIPQFKDTLGWVNYRRGDYKAAVPLLEDASSKLPNFPIIRYHLGMSYLAAGQNEKASEEFKKALELAPNDSELKSKIDAALKKLPDKVKG